MSIKNSLPAFVLTFSFVIIFLSGCTEEKQSPKEILITTNSDEALNLFIKGRDMFDKLKTPQAAELFDQAIAKDKDFAMAYLYRASSGGGYKVFRENIAKAVELIDKVSNGEKHQILYAKADADNDEVTRKKELDSLLTLYPEDKRVHELAGLYYYATVQNYPKAVEHLNKAIDLDSTFASCYNQLGYINMDLGNIPVAEKAFMKYIELIPGEANPYDSYAEFLSRQGRFDESIVQYKKAYQTDPQFVLSLIGLGNNYVFKRNYSVARDYYQQYFEKAYNVNQKLTAYWWKAASYIHEGNINTAIKVFDERSKLAMDNNSPTAAIGGFRFASFVLLDKGNINESEKYLKKAEDLFNTVEMNEADRKAYEIYLGLDKCYLQSMKKDIKDADGGLSKLKPTIEERQVPGEIEYYNLVNGVLRFNQSNFNGALEYFGKAGKENPYVWYWQAVTQEKAGNKEEVKKLYPKISNYYVNSVPLALVRERALKKL